MYQEITHAGTAQNKRIVVHVTLDAAFNILSCPPELYQWSCLDPDTVAKLDLFSLFPQLASSRQSIAKSVQTPGDAFVYRYARFLQDAASEKLFDLQIEAFPGVPGKLLLTIAPQTPLTENGGSQALAVLARHNQELLL